MDYSFEKNRIAGGIGADDEYWRALEENKFKLPRCAGCGAWTWPAHFRCAECGSWDFKWAEVEPVGRVFSWTKTWMSFETIRERADSLPYVTVLAELPQAGNARILGVLKGGEEKLSVGAPVQGTIDPPSALTKGYAAIRWSLV